MEKIKDEMEFKEAMIHCAGYMSKQKSQSVEMEVTSENGSVIIGMYLKKGEQ